MPAARQSAAMPGKWAAKSAPSDRRGIEEDPVAGGDVCGHGARDDIARRKLGADTPGHEALARFVDEDRAFAAHGLGDERQRDRADVERGRMKLDEFEIGHDRAGARRQRQPFAAATPADWWCTA